MDGGVPASAFKEAKRRLVERYAQPDDATATIQVLTTLLPIAALWLLAASGPPVVAALVVLPMSLFLMRVFVLMHECGHRSLFRRQELNRAVGFGLGVVSGMPQYVWSRHHAHHHATNGNWAQYRGPLAILSVAEYGALNERQQRAYWRARHILMAPFGGFVYLLLNPRLTWLKGSVRLLAHVLRGEPARTFRTPYWSTAAEYRHMTLNNLVLLSGWALMCAWLGPALFFGVYVASVSLAGAGGIVLFAVQHNFEHSYACGDEGWNYHAAALHGTSYLVLPAWLNWFTADIGYHHVHHLSARIPNYRLAACHFDNEPLFAQVRRVTLAEILPALKYLLWDERSCRLISRAELERQPCTGMSPI